MSIRNSDLDARLAQHKADMLQAVKSVHDEQGRAFVAEVTRGVSQEAERIKSHVDERYSAILDRVEELESRGSTPGKTGAGAGKSAADWEWMKRFDAWVRRPNDSDTKNALAEFESRERKTVTIGVPSDGGHAVPTEIHRQIEALELKLSPVRRLVRVLQASTPSFKLLVDLKGANSGWVGESDTRTQTDTPKLREISPPFGEIYSYPEASEWSLDDVFFSVSDWLAESAAEAFAIAEADAVLRGNGSDKPLGMLNTTPSTAPDHASPLRGAAQYQYLASSTDDSPAVAGITADRLVDLVYSVNSRYRTGATWVMNSQTAGYISKLKDKEGRYIWSESLISGQPPRLLGFNVEILEGMDDISHNAFPVAFGSWSRAYALIDRVGLRILPDPYSRPGFVRYYIRRRTGGAPWNVDAVKFLRTVNP